MSSFPPSDHLDGVAIKQLATHMDDRGYFRELWKADDGIADSIAQTSVTMTLPGVIKAFHGHRNQDDLWYVAEGAARVVLVDLREESPTYRTTQTIVCGQDRPVLIRIPRGVYHGYQVLGSLPVLLVYHTTQVYSAEHPDELRIAWDDPDIGYDWSIKNR